MKALIQQIALCIAVGLSLAVVIVPLVWLFGAGGFIAGMVAGPLVVSWACSKL